MKVAKRRITSAWMYSAHHYGLLNADPTAMYAGSARA
eukprot:CAMPEP_0180807468 /NCGR_PEP_ID=MMETSP1038_2-20121128/63262_1 /TAXON_ID=632150 /ORGANISM="Azadinium spinosum, Strain 3D9" /LENGTH=36 /DNA_ID= /DNA_START= /DNA_END= /DNA_ORIENTATION=